MRVVHKKCSAAEATRLAKKQETHKFEGKSAGTAPRKIADWVCGFANADGGELVLGIEEVEGDTRKLAPYAKPEATNPTLSTLREIEPPIRRLTVRVLELADEGGCLLSVRIPRSWRAHTHATGAMYLRVGSQTIKQRGEKRAAVVAQKRRLRWSRYSAGAATVLLFLGLGLWAAFERARPTVEASWSVYPPDSNPWEVEGYDLELEVGRTSSRGLLDVVLLVETFGALIDVRVVSAGGCEQLKVDIDTEPRKRGGVWSDAPGSAAVIRATRCPPMARPRLRFVAKSEMISDKDSELQPDELRHALSFSWELPVFALRSPLRHEVAGTFRPPPAILQHLGLFIVARSTPASASGAPYYRDDGDVGQIVAFLDRSDYESLPEDKHSLLLVLGTPSVRASLVFEEGAFVGRVRTLRCPQESMVTAPKPEDPVGEDHEFAAVSLYWRGCKPRLAFSPARRGGAGFESFLRNMLEASDEYWGLDATTRID